MSYIPLIYRNSSTLKPTTSKKIKLHNDLLELNDGDYVHLTNQEYQNVKNQASLINDGYLSKKDYSKLFSNINLKINNNPLTGIIYGVNEGYIITNENNDGFLIKAPSNPRIYSISPTINSPYDLTTKQYVDEKINQMFQTLTNVCNDNTILQNELQNYYSEFQIIQPNIDFSINVIKIFLYSDFLSLVKAV